MSSREAFEKWAEGEGFSLRRAANYCEWETRSLCRSLWEAWQLATERAATIVSDAGPVIGSAGVAVVVAKIREGNE